MAASRSRRGAVLHGSRPGPASRLLSPDRAVLLVVDIQERFLPVIHDSIRVVARIKALVRGARLLGVPVVATEQYRKGLGPTAAAVLEEFPPGLPILDKTSFGCLGDEAVAARLKELGRPQVIVCGIEAHVCVSQTVHQLLEAGYQPHVVRDAVSSRSPADADAGFSKMVGSGAAPSCVELALFELMGGSRHPSFREVQALIK